MPWCFFGTVSQSSVIFDQKFPKPNVVALYVVAALFFFFSHAIFLVPF